MLKLAFRNVFRQRLRSALTLAAVGAGVAALILAAGFVHDALLQLREAVIRSQLGHLQVHKAGSAAGGGHAGASFIDEPGAVVALIDGAPHVTAVLQRVSFSGLLGNGRTELPVIGEGVEPGREARLGSSLTIVAGRQLTDGDLDGVLVGEGLAQALRLRPGDRVTILAGSRDGALNTLDLAVIGVFRSFSRDFDSAAVRLPLSAAQELLVTDGVGALVISLDDTANTLPAQRWLAGRLSGTGLEIRTWEELADFYRATRDLYERQFAVLQFIILILVVFGVSSSVNMSAFERAGEFGTMMAAGARRRAVSLLLLAENFLLGLIGAAAGALMGVAAASAISAVGIPMPPPPNSAAGYTAFIRVVPAEVAWACVIGVAAVMLAAVLPAFRVPRLPIVEALRRNV